MEQALSSVRVLDLSWYITGPYCTKLLADFGADVVKVERPGGGDPARKLGPFHRDEPHPEKSGLFHFLNTNDNSETNKKTDDNPGTISICT
ncbi:Formyl-CoA:oxalate CoA-transferase [subsurface metagenome]